MLIPVTAVSEDAVPLLLSSALKVDELKIYEQT